MRSFLSKSRAAANTANSQLRHGGGGARRAPARAVRLAIDVQYTTSKPDRTNQ